MGIFTRDGHNRWRSDLSTYLDGRLKANRLQALEAHLATCLSCRRELAELRSIVSLLRHVPQVSVPHPFTLSQAPSVAKRPWWFSAALPLQYGVAAAAMLLVAVVAGDFLVRPSTTVQRSSFDTSVPSSQAATDSLVPQAAGGATGTVSSLAATTEGGTGTQGVAGAKGDTGAKGDAGAPASAPALPQPNLVPSPLATTGLASKAMPEQATAQASRWPFRLAEIVTAVVLMAFAGLLALQWLLRKRMARS